MSGKEGQGVWMANPRDRRGDDLTMRLWPEEGGPVELISARGPVQRRDNIVREK